MTSFLHGFVLVLYRGRTMVKQRSREREREIDMRIVFGAEHL